MLMLSAVLMISGQSSEPIGSAPSPTSSPVSNVGATSPDGLQIGVDTLSTVRTKLGKPASIISTSDGLTIIVYVSSRTHVKGASFIPLVGMFAGGARANVTTKTFTFDKTGLLKSFASSDLSADCHTTVIGGRCQ